MNVFLLNPPFVPNFIRSARSTWPSISGSNWYPIFLSYAAGWLRVHGHEIKLVDALVTGDTVDSLAAAAREFRTDLLAVYVSQRSLENDMAVAAAIKKKTKCTVVVVGPWCAGMVDEIMGYPAADIVIKREFDGALLDLADGKKPSAVKGIAYRAGKRIADTGERPYLTGKQLDDFPFVTRIYREFLPVDAYHQASLLHPFVDLFTGRGCIWGKCTFCLWPHTIHGGAGYRVRSVENVFSELRYIKKEMPEVKEIFFQDDALPVGRARLLSERMIRENLNLTWSCYMRAFADVETLKLMKRAGCRFLHVGYESADQHVLDLMKKGTNIPDMERFTENTKKAGLRVHGDFILGLEGETVETMKKTISWAAKLGIEGYQFFIPEPEKGTPLYDNLKASQSMDGEGRISYGNLPYGDLKAWRFKAMRQLYFTPSYMARTMRNIDSPEDLFRLVRTAMHVIPGIVKPK